MSNIEFSIDDKKLEALPGETVLKAALRNGIDIPYLCYHPCLSIAGNCRICLVRIKGRPGFHPSCNLPVAPGMEIESDCEDVSAVRKNVMQFITLNHPVDCPVCDKAGECKLQNYHFKYNGSASLSIDAKKHKPKFYDVNERILLDAERCILCSRCVRFTHEISKSGMLGITERGQQSRVEHLESGAAKDDYSDNIIQNCPVGALLSRDFLYKSRVWYLEPVASVCNGCARGCSVDVWRRKHHWKVRALGSEKNRMAYRITAKQNDDINGRWICNKGFDLNKQINDFASRATKPAIGGMDATCQDALSEARKLIFEAKKPAAIVSAHASNEELEAFKKTLGSRVEVYVRKDYEPAAGEVVEDELLIKADKNPNSTKVEELFGKESFSAAAGHDLVLVWGDNVEYSALSGAKIIHLATQKPNGNPDVLIPISTQFERKGSYTNFEGKVNRFEQVFDKPELVLHASDVFGRL
ncbi:2Fe-2S iron-sulfur cluster-binding protein [Geomonas sp. RF6]|uniref:2Fe-2S iron-sulfur cluster-binding protein n=1 Tax=Geomonas sp. RF6 TaxID=2897342 RepID=UPI001E5BCF67|nr:2Fe-2S iron-sulfur cluster-binding protein [Geomonas sp. RF6]UFS72576.1 2Fe-2S iron-sulfur cluster-binding protein [Geomonas sp. RF6]